MAVSKPEDLRNICLVGHNGCGKTTLLENMLSSAGVINRIGTVDEHNTVSDFDEEEKERGHSIDAAVASFPCKNVELNVIDTPRTGLHRPGPGRPGCGRDSPGGGLRGGRRGGEHPPPVRGRRPPRNFARAVVINRIHAENVNLAGVLKLVQESLGPQCRPLNLPTGGGRTWWTR